MGLLDIPLDISILNYRLTCHMQPELAQKAVSAALSGDWKEAVRLNNLILSQNSKDIDALNRLARACAELGHFKKAKTVSLKVLKLDPSNKIATASTLKWSQLKGESVSLSVPSSAETFLEEPGKTKLVDLLHPGPAEVLAKLDAGDVVKLAPHAHRVNVVTLDEKYIGRLPDDLSARLRRLLKLGKEYKVLIKSIDKNNIKIFIRETTKGEAAPDIPSFSAEKIDYVSFTPPELVHKKDESPTATEEVPEE